ncbi:MAG: tRNA (adenosine(37)-N6)-threonylcarbamoyltransferase complex ATPase subunit type 1 TsaE [Nitrospira sp. CR1.3]|nr:tRNA (adenosine(37)-N6)-threonylcarbamoyltransferase complex ATPase subunit type 1 TsaE [Nitrospira sp. CR1.3]
MPSRPSVDRRKSDVGSPPARRPSQGTPSENRWEIISASVRETDRLGQAIGHGLRGGEILALFGPLGAGKTALVRGIAKGLGAATTGVSSPTFVLIHEYRGRLALAHVDLYRIDSLRDLESTGLGEYLSGPTVTVIEWADKGLAWLPDDRLEIELRHLTVESRRVRLAARGPVSIPLLLRTKTEFCRSRTTARRGHPKHRKAQPI